MLKLAQQLEEKRRELEERERAEALAAAEKGESEEEKGAREALAEERRRQAREENAAAERAGEAAKALVKQQDRLDKKQAQVAAAMNQLKMEREMAGAEDLDDMQDEEREEYLAIRQREFEGMEKALAAKQEELLLQQRSNEEMQSALARTAEGQAMTAAELQVMIGQHAQEMEELRTASEAKIGRLQTELASAREALSADQDVLQDRIDEVSGGGLA